MRTEFVEAIKRMQLGDLRVGEQLPREESGTNMWLKNPRTVYVSEPTYEMTPLVTALNGAHIWSKATNLSVIWAVDSKKLPNNYQSVVDQMLALRSIDPQAGFVSRQASVTTSYENDLLVTQIEYTFVKLT